MAGRYTHHQPGCFEQLVNQPRSGPRQAMPPRDRSHVGRRDCDRVGQALSIDRNVALDPRYFLAGVVAFLARAIHVLDALRVDDQKFRLGFAPLSCTSLANHIFLKPAPGR